MKYLPALLFIWFCTAAQAQPAPVASTANTAVASSLVAKAAPGRLYGLQMFNNNVAVRYVLVFDAATLPANGAVTPIMFFLLAGSGSPPSNATRVDMGGVPILFSAGITIGCSSTGPFTLTAAVDCAFAAQSQ